MTTLITKTTQAGKTLIVEYINGEFIGILDGVEIVRHRMPGVYVPGKQLHVLGGKIGLTKAEGQTLIEAERVYAKTIVTQPSRADLVSNYYALIAEQEAAYEHAHSRQDARAMAIRNGYDAKIEAATQAIRDYDAAHPEETAARTADRAETIERNRWM